jgi:4-hydroxybenzoate polyprenyltransferase
MIAERILWIFILFSLMSSGLTWLSTPWWIGPTVVSVGALVVFTLYSIFYRQVPAASDKTSTAHAPGR